MRKRTRSPAKLSSNERSARCWAYCWANGTSVAVSTPGRLGFVDFATSGTSSSTNEVAVKQFRSAAKQYTVNLTLDQNQDVCCIGKFKLLFNEYPEHSLSLSKVNCALKFDHTDPSRTLVLHFSTGVSTSSVYHCSIQWSDRHSYIDGHMYNSDDLLTDLAIASRHLICNINFSESEAVVFVKLAQIDDQFIPERDGVPNNKDVALGYILRYFHGIPILYDSLYKGLLQKNDTPSDWAKLFAKTKVRVTMGSANYSAISQVDEASQLVTTLRTYQRDAVKWMLWRENASQSACDAPFHSLFQAIFGIVLPDSGNAFFHNKISCRPCIALPTEIVTPTGGFICDEMGLGKTLEVLALIVSNPRRISDTRKDATSEDSAVSWGTFSCVCGGLTSISDLVACIDCGSIQHSDCVGWTSPLNQHYRCPYCILNHGKIDSRATLVVTPMAICSQWADEISRHVTRSPALKSFKVFTYPGVKSSKIYIQPETLADNDVVLVSYETLRTELSNAKLQFEDRSTSLRTSKRFMAVPSPLPAICWWRLCLDEAQMVESHNNAAQMVQFLSCVHRWCITGTPVVHSVNDIFGLLEFLRVPIFSSKLYWNQLILKPYSEGNFEPLVDLLATIFWRTTKNSVLDQIGVPPIIENITYLTFSPVEEHVYRYRYSTSKLNSTVGELAQFDRYTPLRHLDRRVVNRFLEPVLPLRRACSDFGKKMHVGVQQHSLKMPMSMTMDQVLNDLIHRAIGICTDYHRQFICALNGLAGLETIKRKYSSAIDLYRQVLWSARDNIMFCETDKLQLIHATHNLYEVIHIAKNAGDTSIAEAAGDSELPQRKTQLIVAFVGKLDSKVQENKDAVCRCKDAIAKLDEDFYDDWWAEICERLLQKLSDDELGDFYGRLQNSLRDTCAGSLTLSNYLNSRHSFVMALSKNIDTLATRRRFWSDAVNTLIKTPPAELSNKLSLCSCTTDTSKQPSHESCAFCTAMKHCVAYEKVLFSARRNHSATVENGDGNEIWAWSESETERTLKFLLMFAKRNIKRFESTLGTDATELMESGDKHIERLQSLKTEFRNLRQLWASFRDRVGAEIELSMASNRLQLIEDSNITENLSTTSRGTVISSGTAFVSNSEIDSLIDSNKRDADAAKSDFEKACGQLRYLRSLEKTVSASATNEETCPVCMCQLGYSWAVLPCAHCVCLACATTLGTVVLQNRRLPCPVCRHTLQLHEVAYVSLRSVDAVFPEVTEASVKGSYSTKIMAAVKTVKVVLLQDPSAKFLIFSSWMEALHSLLHALTENNVSAIILQKGTISRKQQNNIGEPSVNKFTDALRRFRSVDDGSDVKVLLLPYLSGSNGLNLVEANHVILLDPCLTQAVDCQAVARVYRMGQTRPTTVHRLLIRSTIEERIYSVLLKKRHHEHDHVLIEEENDAVAEQDADGLTDDAVIGDLIDLYRSELSQGAKATDGRSTDAIVVS